MKERKFCQSCSMPLDSTELMGTEKDNSKSEEYCKYCYQEGAFVNPGMTLDEMRKLVITKMEESKAPADIIEVAVGSLPQLKRWRRKTPSL